MNAYFPFDLFDPHWLSVNCGEVGRRIAALSSLSLRPPFPWGQWLYGRLLKERAAYLGGDIVECGVGMGGMSLFLGGLARQLGRKVYSVDSFSGLPPPDPAYDNCYFRAGDYAGEDGAPDLLERFRAAICDAGLVETIIPIPGFFATSLNELPQRNRYSFVHVDVDLYHSTYEALEKLFPSIVDGGLLVIDDFFHHSQGPARAAYVYFSSIDYLPFYHVSFPYGVVVIKGEAPPPSLHRAIDGNRYSLDFIRRDDTFLQRLSHSLAHAEGTGAWREAEKARRFCDLLKPERRDTSADIYEYWAALADFWDAADAISPSQRKSITL